MAWIALLRHGVTDWNERGLIQGRTDIPLNAAGIKKLKQVRPGDAFLRAHWMTSPLRRAMQTAALLNPGATAEIHLDLVEANWGAFEGTRRDDLPQRIRELGLEPARGLDFLPPGGESARMVRRRLMNWFAAVAAHGNADRAVVAVTHKGVLRSALSMACQWDMSADFERTTDWALPHVFRFTGGELQLARLNCPWDEPPGEWPDESIRQRPQRSP